MIFQPKKQINLTGSFIFSNQVIAAAHPCMSKPAIQEFWHGFTFRTSALQISETDTFTFTVGNARPLPLDGYAYSINVAPDGICVFAKSEKDLLQGFMTLLDRFRMIDTDYATAIEIKCVQIWDRPIMSNRMVHFCVFPETELWELQRFTRLCAALRFTHVIIEFWGMLKYDCMKELGWPHAFTKEEIRPIIEEAKDLGLEIIPMFNHWGHASAGRVMHGKHVVLDQNPSLQSYFSEDGWCWNIGSPRARALLRQIRAELIELCGEGSYFHIGCDEAFNFEFTIENMNYLCDFINEISGELATAGRRAISWGDMFLYRHPHYNPNNYYHANAPTPEVESAMLERLDRRILIADWQYDATEAPVETAFVFQKAGFDTLLCPWDCSEAKLKSCVTTVKDHNLTGLLHTTWHTLSKNMPYVTIAALGGLQSIDAYKRRQARTHTAALLRKVWFVDGDYKKAGWGEFEITTAW